MKKKAQIPVANTNQRHPQIIHDMLKTIAGDEGMSQSAAVAMLISLEYGRRHPPIELAQEVERLKKRVAQLEMWLESSKEMERVWEKSFRESETKRIDLWNYYLFAIGQHDVGDEWWAWQEKQGHPDWIASHLPK